MADFKTTCETIVKDMSTPMEFIHTWVRYGDQFDDQLNVLLDEHEFKIPVFVLFETPVEDNPNEGGTIISDIPMAGLILYRIPGEAEQLSAKIGTALNNINDAKRAAREFLFALDASEEVARTSRTIEERRIIPVDSAFDAITFGVAINATVPFTETITGCPA